MLDQRLAAGPVEHFRSRRFHPRAEAGGEDDDCQFRFHHDFSKSLSRRCLPSSASCSATAATACGLCLTVADSCSSSRATTSSPRLLSASKSTSTGLTCWRADFLRKEGGTEPTLTTA